MATKKKRGAKEVSEAHDLTIKVRVTAQQHRDLKVAAALAGCTVSELLRTAGVEKATALIRREYGKPGQG